DEDRLGLSEQPSEDQCRASHLSYEEEHTVLRIISVYTGDDESVTALTDDGMDELEQMLKDARRSPQEWNDFLDSFVGDELLVARIKGKRLANGVRPEVPRHKRLELGYRPA
ncbi:hypothetical protein RJJ64_33180, partial [Rhizobium hidalgonense]|nr:hypothetical protein [Rhizobium hidalgonense]